MRILEVRLLAFGPFTGLTLDLSGDQSGLHIIYGPNEAGKSASLRALTALFRGIPVRTTDNFLHDNQNLRIGALIRNSAGEEFSFIRRKGSKDTLLDHDGKPIPESTLAKYLNSGGEDLFTTMFAMDHESLIRGGEQILQGGGAIGESLFAAGLGGTNLREILQGLEDEASRLFLPKGKLQKINKAIAGYKEARQRGLEASLPSKEWAEHDAALKDALIRKEQIDEELKKTETEKERIERLLKALPKVAELKDLVARLDAFGQIKNLSPSFGKRMRDALGRLNSSRERERTATEALGRIARKMETLVIPEALLKEAESIAGLHEQLGSHRKAYRDLPRLQGERLQLAANAEAILKELSPDVSLEGVEVLRITAAKRARIRELGNKYQLLEGKVQRGAQDLEHLRLKLAAKKEQQKLLEAQRDPARLRAAVLRAQKRGEIEEDLDAAVKEHRRIHNEVQIQLKRLRLWTGAMEEVESLAVPAPETIDRFDSAFDALEKRLQVLADRTLHHEESKADMERRIHELRLAGQVPSENELDAARKRRQAGWEIVRRSWLDGSENAEEVRAFAHEDQLHIAYEKSVLDADLLADRLRREADRVTQQAGLVVQLGKCSGDLASNEEERQRAARELGALQHEWLDLWRPMRISPLTPKEMRSWTARLEKLVKLVRELNAAGSRVEIVRQRIDEHRAEIGRCLEDLGESAAGSDETLDLIINRSLIVAGQIEDTERRRRELEKAVAQIEEDISRAERDKEAAKAELSAWRGEWLQSIMALRLEENALPAEVNTVLDKVEELFKVVDKMAGLTGRITGILHDGEQFERAVRELVERAAPDLSGLSPDQGAVELIARARKAGEDAATMAELRERHVELENAVSEARLDGSQAEIQLKELCTEASCSEYSQLEELEERASLAQAIRKDISAVEKQLLDYCGSSTLKELILKAEAADADSLPFQLAETRQKIDELGRDRSELLEGIGMLKTRLDMMDGSSEAAEAAEKAQGIVAEIREGAERYIRLRLASAILHREIERYRAENQAPLLRRSADMFSKLTLGSFAGLQADFNDMDEPVLLGIRPDGQRIAVEGMSEGTRDQLFLSLRLASLEKYLAGNEPIPLIVDDILINFDDRRAAATLDLLADLSSKTQIIFFTHHTHLVDLARATLGSGLNYCNLGRIAP